MTPPGTFERVYAAIRQRLREGLYRPGDRLEPAVLAEELNASVTPVRDALHRLTGERLVDAPRHEGFRMPMMTETTLRHLYAWHLDLLLLAVTKHRASAAATRQDRTRGLRHAGPEPDGQGQRDPFVELARSTGNPEHVAAIESLQERLQPFQKLEHEFLDGTDTETSDILSALKAKDRRALRSSLVRYHRRRQQIVPQLLALLQR